MNPASRCRHNPSELDRRDDGLDIEAAELIRRILEWTEKQIRRLRRRGARECLA
jgi:hypothetical protein